MSFRRNISYICTITFKSDIQKDQNGIVTFQAHAL